MATTGYIGALGGMAKDAAIGAGKGFVGGLKGAMMSEAPGITGAYAFGKELRSRANAPKMPSGGSAPSAGANKPSSSNSPMAGGLGATNEKTIVAGLRQSNIINLEQVRQLKQLNDNVINQSKLLKFTVDDTKRRDQFAEEIANEQANRDGRLLDAIKRIGSSDNKKRTKADDMKESSFLGKLVNLIGTLAEGYLGYKFAKVAGGAAGGVAASVAGGVAGGVAGNFAARALGGMAGRGALGMAGRALPRGAISVLDASGKVIAGAGARSALVESIATIVPMVLRFLTGPVGLGIMAAVGLGSYISSKGDPEKAAAAAAAFRKKQLGKEPPASAGKHAKSALTQKEAQALLEDRKLNEEDAQKAEKAYKTAQLDTSPTEQNKTKIQTAKINAENARTKVNREIIAFGGFNRVDTIARGGKDPGAAVSMSTYLANLARTESANEKNPKGDPNAKNPNSTAAGLYQFIGDPKDAKGDPIKDARGNVKEGTWKTTVRKMIASGALTKKDAEDNYLDDKFRFDPVKATQVAEYFTEEHRKELVKALGRDPTQADLYMAHFLGLGDNKSGAIEYLKMMKDSPNAVGANIVSAKVAADNKFIFYKGGDITKPRTISEIYKIMGEKIAGKSELPTQTVEAALENKTFPPPGKNNTREMKDAGSSSIPFGEESYNTNSVPAAKPIPLEADAPFFNQQREKRQKEEKLNELIAERNIKDEKLDRIVRGVNPNSPVPKDTEALIKKLQDEIIKIDEKILLIRGGNKPATRGVTPVIPEKIDRINKRSSQLGFNNFIKPNDDEIAASMLPKADVLQSGVFGESTGELSAEQRARFGLDSPLFANAYTNTPEQFAANVLKNGIQFAGHGLGLGKVTSSDAGPGKQSVNHEDEQGFSEEYLRSVIDGTHPKPLPTVENAKKQLAALLEERKRKFLTSEKSSYEENTKVLGYKPPAKQQSTGNNASPIQSPVSTTQNLSLPIPAAQAQYDNDTKVLTYNGKQYKWDPNAQSTGQGEFVWAPFTAVGIRGYGTTVVELNSKGTFTKYVKPTAPAAPAIQSSPTLVNNNDMTSADRAEFEAKQKASNDKQKAYDAAVTIAEIEEQTEREFLKVGQSTYGKNTAGVELSKESNPFVELIERLLVFFRGSRRSDVKLGPDYVDNAFIDDSFDRLASGTKIATKEIVTVVAPATDKLLEAGFSQGTGGAAVAKAAPLAQSGRAILAKAPPPFKPDYKSNTDIIAEANKQFLNELRSTLTGLTRKELKAALLPDGVGVSFGQANQDNLFRGEQLKQINDTSKKINEGAINLFGKEIGPMFAPMLDRMSTSYFEAGSRIVGGQLFNKFGGLDAKETMGITGQVIGNIAAGKKQLAAEQLLFGMSGGRKTGIALNVESLFAKYGFEDPEQGISYFADVLGEKATQYTGLPKLLGANDRNKSIVRDPRTGKSVYVDSGIEASKEDIQAGYGGRISQTSILPAQYDNFAPISFAGQQAISGAVAGKGGPKDQFAILDDKGEVRGRMAAGMPNYSGAQNSAETIRQIMAANSENVSRNAVFGTTQAERDKGGPALVAREDTFVRAQTELANREIQTQKDLAKAAAKRDYDAALKAAKTEEDANNETNKYNKTLSEIEVASGVRNADAVINTLNKGTAGDGTDPTGLRVSGRRPGQLFDATNGGQRDTKGNLIIDPMKEIGNFGFDILKLAAGSELTKDIKNPYMQTITNFAIQKGMNYAVEAMMNSMTSTAAASSGGGGYGEIGKMASSAFSWITNLWPFKDGGLVQRHQDGGKVEGAGTGTSDSIPALLSNGEFVVNAYAAAANMDLLNAINKSTLPKKTGGGTNYIDNGGPGSQGDFGGSGSPGGLGVGPGQGVSTSTQSVALAVMAFADKYPGWAPGGLAVQIAGWLAGKAADSQMEKMDNAVKAIDAIDKANEAALANGSSRTFDPYNGTKGVLSVSDENGNVKSFDPYAGDSAKDAGRRGPAADTNKGPAALGPRTADALASFLGASADLGKPGGGDVAEGSYADPGEKGGEHMAKGGLITGKGSGTSDSIFAMLSDGEFVINAKATKANLSILKQINSYTGSGSVSKSQSDSNLSIEPFKNKFKGFADGGLVTAANKSSTMNAVPRPTSRSPYILSPQTNNSSSENQNNSSNMIIGPKTSTRIDNSSVTNFYNQASGMIDSIRSVTPQMA